MTESAATAILPATSLGLFLASAAKPPRLAEYRCVLTPRKLDVPEAEIAALLSGAAVHDLGWMRRAAVRGDDRFRWLSGMVTNMVKDLPPAGGAWNFVLNAQGRIQGDLAVWRENDSLEIEMHAEQFERLLDYLNRFIIMDDVELVPLGQEPGAAETALGLTGPKAGEVLGRMGLPTLPEPMTSTRVEWNGLNVRILRGYGALAAHYEIWLPASGVQKIWPGFSTAGATPIGVEAVEAFRIAEGMPLYGVDIQEKDLPQETSQLRAIHFNKGCYIGQEIVERIRSRGNVHRQLRHLELDGPVPKPGTELVFENKSAGHVTSAAALDCKGKSRVFALAIVTQAKDGNQLFSYSEGTSTGTARILDGPPKFESPR